MAAMDRKVRRLAYDDLLLGSTRANQIADYDQPCGNAYTGLQGCVGLEVRNCHSHFQPCANSPFCVVLVSLWVAEVD